MKDIEKQVAEDGLLEYTIRNVDVIVVDRE